MTVDPDGNNIFQILISDEPNQDLRNLPTLKANRDSFESLHPELHYALLSNDDLRAIIAAHFGAPVLATYDALVPFAYKADLARYCLLYAFGGIYADLSMRLLSRLTLPPGKELLCFRDAYVNGGSSWAVSNGLIRAVPGRPEFRTAIDLIVQNHRDLYYGPSLLHPTGPALFGRAIAMTNRGETLEVGDFRNVTGTAHPLSYAYVDGAGRLVCIRMKEAGGDLALVGVKGVNMYDGVWRLRSIYGEPIVIDHTDERLRLLQSHRVPDGIQIAPDMDGCVIFGPYIDLPAGTYVGRYRFGHDFKTTALTIDIVTEAGLIAQSRTERLDEDGTTSLTFDLDRRTPNFQLRLTVHGGSTGLCKGMTIERLSAYRAPRVFTYSE